MDHATLLSLSDSFPWPPKKKDLERLYLDEKLSAAKIAKVYSLKYKNPKVAESTVLYQLKRNGIKRRDPAEHIRKVTEELVDEWVRGYQTGESLKEIAGEEYSATTIMVHLRKRGVKRRDKVEAQIRAVTKYEKRPFRGDSVEEAYLMGLRYGDLDAVRHGRAIRVRVSTTHPAMANLFESIFSPYGHVLRYPRTAPFTGYEWTLEVDLDRSFEFLLEKPSMQDLDSLTPSEILSFLAGIFDAEGTIYLHRKGFGAGFESSIANGDSHLINLISKWLGALGFHPSVESAAQDPFRLGYLSEGMILRVSLFRKSEVCNFLGIISLRHKEKISKRDFVLRSACVEETRIGTTVIHDWEILTLGIRNERNMFVEKAKLAMQAELPERRK